MDVVVGQEGLDADLVQMFLQLTCEFSIFVRVADEGPNGNMW